MSTEKPNFLIIAVDQMRADHLGFSGNQIVRTPNLDQLAASGTAFSRAYVNCPLCMPSRATLMTGQTPRGHGVRTNGIPLRSALPTLPSLLQAAGYRTASIGKIHLSNYELYDSIGASMEGASAQTPADARFPELRSAWQSGQVSSVPTPYYGFEHVELTVGHGCEVEGDYARWLREQHPQEWKLLQRGATPSPGGAEGCGRFPLAENLHHTSWVADRAIEYLRSAGEGGFFLVCSFPDPHHPYVVPAPWDELYDADSLPLPPSREGELDELHPLFRDAFENDVTLSGRRRATRMSDRHRREIIAHTYGMVSLLDKHIGRVLEALETAGHRNRTIVLFLSDHGDLMGDHGLLNKGPFHFEGLLRVPFLCSWPGRFAQQRSDALASLLDFVPTVLDLAGVDYPDTGGVSAQASALPGSSLVPVLTGAQSEVQDSVMIENDEDYLGLRLRTIVTRRFKLTTYTASHGPELHGELFDLRDDPYELHNLWAHPGFGEVRGQLTEMLLHRMVATDPTQPRRLGHA